MVRSWRRALFGTLLVVAVAVAGIALNFTLLRLTQDSNDPVGRLSPRAVFNEPSDLTPSSGPDDSSTTGPATVPSGERDGDD